MYDPYICSITSNAIKRVPFLCRKENMKYDRTVLLCCVVAWFCCSVVECHGHLLDAIGNRKLLKKGNLADEDRPENGVIKTTKIHEDILVKPKSAAIFNDKGDEDAIKISDDVCKEDFPKCVSSGGKCYGKVVTENEQSATQCLCPGNSVYETDKGCIVPDQVCQSEFPKCMDTGGKCKVRVEKDSEKSAVYCDCHIKLWYEAGKGCIVSERQCDVSFPKCKETGGNCYLNDEKVDCECPKMNGYKARAGCTDCECGNNSKGCKFAADGKKVCECFEQFAQKGDICAGKNEKGHNIE